MSWRDAKPLLENMNGPEAPASWQGGMPIKYRLTGVRVRVKVDMDNSVKPNYVVEARIRGSEYPDEWIILGNHRDAWEFGAVDPSSGTASMLDLTHALGALKKRGIRPRRTLVFCSWDGEEVGLTGSTEWGEHFADELKKKAVAYLNVDSSASGPSFSPDAVASLAPLIVEVSRDLGSPSGRTLYVDLRARIAAERASLKQIGPVADSMLVDTKIGSGSDHTVFLNHLGIPTIGLTFEGPYGVYHSIYDNFYWMNRFGDPGYRYHVLCSKVWGLIALRLSNAEVLPFDFASYAEGIRGFIADFARIAGVTDNLKLGSLLDQTSEFERAGHSLNQSVARRLASGSLSAEVARQVNERIREVERRWLDPSGLPGREWFKHILYAARFTYAHLELPGLTEAAERGDWTAAQAQLKILEDAIKDNSVAVEKTASNLR
jgi:N-acetylated-alpha-linked acidic dipeptidase